MKIGKYNLFCILGAFLSTSAITIILKMNTSNLLSAIFAVIFYCFYKNQKPNQEKHRKLIRTAGVVASVWAFFMMLKGLESFDNYPNLGAIGKLIIIVCVLAGFVVLFFYIIYFIYVQMLKISSSISEINPQKCFYKIFLIAFIAILLCWLPYYFMNYPGVVISDSCDQMGQAITGNYSNHHPIIQTWIIEGVLTLGMQLFTNLNAAVALYCIMQMIIIAAIYAYTVGILYKYGIHRWACVVITVFYALIPYNVMFSFNMWKDSLFSAFLLLFTVLIWKTVIDLKGNSTKIRIGDIILFILSGLGICLFRNNGFYAFLLVLPFLCLICWKTRKAIVASTIAILLATLIIKGPVFNYFEVETQDFVESLSIPAQQIARVVSDGLEITEEQTALLNQIISVDSIAVTYDPRISDPIKGLIRSQGNQEYLAEHKAEYLKVWFEIGMHYPFQYLRAYMNQTEGYWNPDVQYWVYTEGVSQNQVGVTAEPLIPEYIGNRLKWFAWDSYEIIPLYGLLWSIGTAVWITMLLAGFCYVRGKKKELCIFLPIMALWGTIMIATPVYAEFRYIYAIFLCMPLFMAASIYPDKREQVE